MACLVRAPKSFSLAKPASIRWAWQGAIVDHPVSYRSRRPLSTSQKAADAVSDATLKPGAKDQSTKQATPPTKPLLKKKTMAELDEELRLKLEGISGDGGASGVEYENGKAQGLKRNVKANMFRVI